MSASSPFDLVGFQFLPGYFDRQAQSALIDEIRQIVATAPLFRPVMPRTGKPFSVKMSNCGPLGWVADRSGYRYQPHHPDTGAPWPEMPGMLLDLWNQLAPNSASPEACLINFYQSNAKMGLHQDRDEQDFTAPVVSVSLGDTALFRLGGHERKSPTRSLKLQSGDVIVLGGDARLSFHGIDRLYPNTSSLLTNGGRINLTLRRVTSPAFD
ncbi:alkylated DNA repair protein (DNA oxidative demethylase) [Roseibium hamelinense]|uniref:Alkylated DNA repair protein (DNA oxidative demethylase) n=1 Tax=Roseibium hamelinense TaxID=150831 RepID=A0A562T341_9HYPH|nr:alpha-ketoglutarate-dependent dioxygenase AlkB [Roseibium hamelinense]MTI44687.1 alpha-ketoglutarate-dependent dioxygenase AlkB [Roseibium hamelinense]TWI87316.1 alkylated DNA repair protein (DNA oxidative demethylase) [Roseibium hamelinense]